MGSGRSGLPRGVKDISNKTTGKQVKKTFRDILNERSNDVEGHLNTDYLAPTNPHRDDWKISTSNIPYRWYRENCQRVCYAVDLQLSGFDVEALPNKRKDGAGSMYGPNSYRNVYDGAKWDDFSASSTDAYLRHIESLIPKSGDKCIIGCFWNSGGGHLFNAVNIGGKIYGVDGQVTTSSGGHLFNLNDYVRDFKVGSNMDVLVTSDMSYKTTQLLRKFVKRRRKN